MQNYMEIWLRGNHTVGKWERVTRNSPPLVLISQGVGRSIATGMTEVAKHPWLDCVLKVGLWSDTFQKRPKFYRQTKPNQTKPTRLLCCELPRQVMTTVTAHSSLTLLLVARSPTNKQFPISRTDHKTQNTFCHSSLCCFLRLVLKTEDSAG